ncbi:MAG: proline dehydrogenase family protein [Bacteroidota bacterium]
MSLINSLVVTVLPLIPKSIVGKVAKRYIAGTKLSDAVHSVQMLNQNFITTTMDLLGEDVTNIEEVEIIKKGILGILRAIQVNKLRSGVSVKPTQLGLKLDKELAYRNIKAIIMEAAHSGIFVRIDMEDSSTTDATISLYRRLKAEGWRNTGVVIQACLKRSEADIRDLVKENADFRLCKGIYDESPSIAFKGRQEIRDNYLKLLRIILESGSQVGIATHDDFLIDGSQRLLEEIHVPHEKYEFQMLLGVREKKRAEIVRAGHRLRVYIPFGEQWYAYSTRRLKENPLMAWYITKAIFISS